MNKRRRTSETMEVRKLIFYIYAFNSHCFFHEVQKEVLVGAEVKERRILFPREEQWKILYSRLASDCMPAFSCRKIILTCGEKKKRKEKSACRQVKNQIWLFLRKVTEFWKHFFSSVYFVLFHHSWIIWVKIKPE